MQHSHTPITSALRKYGAGLCIYSRSINYPLSNLLSVDRHQKIVHIFSVLTQTHVGVCTPWRDSVKDSGGGLYKFNACSCLHRILQCKLQLGYAFKIS